MVELVGNYWIAAAIMVAGLGIVISFIYLQMTFRLKDDLIMRKKIRGTLRIEEKVKTKARVMQLITDSPEASQIIVDQKVFTCLKIGDSIEAEVAEKSGFLLNSQEVVEGSQHNG